jgi:chromosome segregation and condensation protein ScpB
MNEAEQRRIAEALILASPEPVPAARLASLIPDCSAARARALVEALNAQYTEQDRAFEICEVAGGYQACPRPPWRPWRSSPTDSR